MTTTCTHRNVASPNSRGYFETFISLDENCNNATNAYTNILQLWSLGNEINTMSKISIKNTIQQIDESSDDDDDDSSPIVAESFFFTTVDFNTSKIGLSFKEDETPVNNISTYKYIAEILTTQVDQITKYFQVQVRILYKQDDISVNRGDVFTINSVYYPDKSEFLTEAQYQVQPKSMIQSQVWNNHYKTSNERSINKSNKSLFKSDKSERIITANASRTPVKNFLECRDKHYDKYNTRR
jgi:hypothetical protein